MSTDATAATTAVDGDGAGSDGGSSDGGRGMSAKSGAVAASPGDARTRLVLIGAGGHASVCAACVLANPASPYALAGALDDSYIDDDSGGGGGGDAGGTSASASSEGAAANVAAVGMALRVLGRIPREPGALADGGPVGPARDIKRGTTAYHLGVGSIPFRKALVEAHGGAKWATIIDATATVRFPKRIGAGSLLCTQSVVHPNAAVGEHVIVNTGAIVEHDCVVGDLAFLGPRAVLLGKAQVGARTMVGASAVVFPAVRVGNDCTVGAGAVVRHDVPDGATVVGVPAREASTGVDGAVSKGVAQYSC